MVLEDIPVPQINDDTMLIRLKLVQFVVLIYGYFARGDSRAKYPVVIRHEIAGIIEKLGANISNFKEGDKVCVAPGHGCGECEMCKKGSPNVCLSPNHQ